MANNLHVSYDLYSPGQKYEDVIAKIKTLGNWAKIHKSYWYVNSTYSAREAVNIVWPVMDSNDSIYIADTTNNNAAWENLTDEVAAFIRNHWNK
jgi:hypothetical protein